MLWLVAFIFDMFDSMDTIPSRFDSSDHLHCRAYHTIWNQGDCGSCMAFATATAYGMSRCAAGLDELPSPHRMFDCMGGSCTEGASLLMVYAAMRAGVPDINSTAPIYGMGCQHGPYKASVDYYFGRRRIQRGLMERGAMLHGVKGDELLQQYKTGVYNHESSGTDHALVVT